MATKPKSSKKVAAPGQEHRNGLQTVRDDELLTRNPTSEVVFVGDRTRNGPNPLDNYAWVVEPDTPTILKKHLFRDPRHDGARLLKTGQLEIVNGEYGTLPRAVNIADSAARAEARDGKRPGPNRQELITTWRGVVLDWSLAESIVDCLAAGLPETATVRELVDVYDRSFIEQRASARPWVARSQELIALAKTARLETAGSE
jgi:hypothetical protein